MLWSCLRILVVKTNSFVYKDLFNLFNSGFKKQITRIVTCLFVVVTKSVKEIKKLFVKVQFFLWDSCLLSQWLNVALFLKMGRRGGRLTRNFDMLNIGKLFMIKIYLIPIIRYGVIFFHEKKIDNINVRYLCLKIHCNCFVSISDIFLDAH